MHLSPNGLVLLVWAVVPKLQLVNGVKLGRLALALRRDWCAESMRTASQDKILRKKGLMKVFSELLEMKDTIKTMCGNMRLKYHAFLSFILFDIGSTLG